MAASRGIVDPHQVRSGWIHVKRVEEWSKQSSLHYLQHHRVMWCDEPYGATRELGSSGDRFQARVNPRVKGFTPSSQEEFRILLCSTWSVSFCHIPPCPQLTGRVYPVVLGRVQNTPLFHMVWFCDIPPCKQLTDCLRPRRTTTALTFMMEKIMHKLQVLAKCCTGRVTTASMQCTTWLSNGKKSGHRKLCTLLYRAKYIRISRNHLQEAHSGHVYVRVLRRSQ